MNMKERTIKKRYFILALIGLVIAVVLAVKFYVDYHHASNNEALTRQDVAELRLQLDSISQKSYADELFIKGHHDSALVAYEKIPNMSASSELLKNRRTIKAQMYDYQQNLLQQAREAAELLDLSKNLTELEVLALKSKHENMSDSLQVALGNRIETLETDLLVKEEESAKAPRIGKLSFKNKNGTEVSYFGEIVNGRANGQGIGTHQTGSVYDGQWQNNLKHGKGIYKWKQGEVYEGGFVNDKREGQGTYLWTNGNKYVGSWRNDRRDGYGTLYDNENKVLLEGTWKNDELVKK